MGDITSRPAAGRDARSRRLAKLVGPTLTAITLAEMEFIQPDLYAGQTPVGVYAAGMLMFVAGLAIVRDHNLWVRRWPVLLTLIGWAALLLGLARLFFATSYPATLRGGPTILVTEIVLVLLGLYLSWQGFRRVHLSADGPHSSGG